MSHMLRSAQLLRAFSFGSASQVQWKCNRSLSQLLTSKSNLFNRTAPSIVTSQVRFESSSQTSSQSFAEIAQQIADPNTKEINLEGFHVPEPPQIPEALAEVIRTGPLTASDLDITSWLPTGWIYNMLDSVHNLGLPWWATIVSATLVARCLMFPLIVSTQKKTHRLREITPQLKELQEKLKEIKQTGSTMDLLKFSSVQAEILDKPEMKEYMQMSKFNMIKMPLIQGLTFSSFFITLRTMANYPVESLKDGGLFWFIDLTQSDPFYALPLMTSISMFAVLKIGIDFGTSSLASGPLQKGLMYGFPPLIFFLTMNFSTALGVYWLTSNVFSIAQVSILNTPRLRKMLDMPEIYVPPVPSVSAPTTNPLKTATSAVKDVKSWYKSMQVESKVASLSDQDLDAFRKAGIGPLKRTFKHDPTKE